MPSDQSLLARQIERVELRPFTLERFHRRRQRKERNRRIGAAVVALAVAAAGIGVLARAFSSRTVPASDPFLGVFEPVAGRIVYVNEGVDRGYDRGLWAVDPSGPSDSREGPSVADDVASTLVRLGLEEARPLGWSSDGTELLFARTDGDPLFPQGHLYILHADGSETRLTRDPMRIADATIAPDGTRVVFAASDETLYLVDAEGGRPVRLPVPLDGSAPTFSPDGMQIAYLVTGDDEEGHVWVADVDGSEAHEILAIEATAFRGVSGLQWSPAGDRLAIGLGMARGGGRPAIYTFAPDGSDFTQVITGGISPYWSPDGSQIAYTIPCDEHPDGWCPEGSILRSEFDPQPGESPAGLAIADADGSNVRAFGFAASGPWHPAPANQPTPSPAPSESVLRSLLDGEVTFEFGPPWEPSPFGLQHGPTWTTLDGPDGGSVVLIADPLPIETGCRKGPAPADAEALAQSIRSDPDLEAAEPVAADVAGIEALRMDVVAATGASVCQRVGPPLVLRPGSAVTAGYLPPEQRMRLYLLDLPGGSTRILAIAIVAQQSSFEDVVQAAMPIVDSFEFRTG
jgi:hypothetical protein